MFSVLYPQIKKIYQSYRKTQEHLKKVLLFPNPCFYRQVDSPQVKPVAKKTGLSFSLTENYYDFLLVAELLRIIKYGSKIGSEVLSVSGKFEIIKNTGPEKNQNKNKVQKSFFLNAN